jgi:uncharacterized protein
MKDRVTWFEIPTRNLDRAANFYEAVLGVTLWRETVAGIPHAIFPFEEGGISGALATSAATLPGSLGTIVYLACEDVEIALKRAQAAGGEVVTPASVLSNIGTIAALKDLDTNTVGLHGRP